ncbi:MAG: group 1 truncated hemoglobin [Gemmatales bacterium]|nr:MAG: group 1 truncated hemoglobin [Gemmatales bacterium]
MTSLFERLGGDDAIHLAVDKFYDHILADERIKHFFVGIDMVKQRGHQRRFLKYAFGGSPNYPGRSMREAHRRLVEEMNLSDQHFDAVAENLTLTLKELNVASDLIDEVLAIVESTRDDVLNR